MGGLLPLRSAWVAGVAGFDDPAFYGDRWAGVYDEHHAEMDPVPAVESLAGLAGGGRVLELAIGTGRVALPLAGRGITVEGIDASEATVERLRAKPGGELIPVVIGDGRCPRQRAVQRGVPGLQHAVRPAPGRLSASATSLTCSARAGCSSSNASSLTWPGSTGVSGCRHAR